MVSKQLFLTATHAVSAIQTLVTSAAPHGDMSAGITSRCIALHAFGGHVHGI
jgi:hypothetical protein